MNHARALLIESRKTLGSLASLSLSLTGELFYSLILVSARAQLVAYPLVTALIPVMASIRGGVYTSIASKVSTLLHLGYELGGLGGKRVRSLHSSVVVVLAGLSLLVALLTSLLHPGVGLLPALYASLSGFALAHLAIFPTVLAMAQGAFRRGLNPDNILAPLVTLLGDVWTVPALLIVVVTLEARGWPAALALLAILLSLNLVLAGAPGARGGGARLALDLQLARQLGASMIAAVVIEVGAGSVLARGIEGLAANPALLGALPIMMQAGGAIVSIVASRVSTSLHLGHYPPRLAPTVLILVEYFRSGILVLIAYPLAGLVGWVSALLLGHPGPLGEVVSSSVRVGFFIVLAGPLLAHTLAVIAFRRGWDPDSVSLPLLTSTMDFATIVLVVAGMD